MGETHYQHPQQHLLFDLPQTQGLSNDVGWQKHKGIQGHIA